MKYVLPLSLACAVLLSADDISLDTLEIQSTAITDLNSEAVKSADLAEALDRVPSLHLIRRSGIANDVLLRGQKRDNINVTLDGSKVCGACPNRMDPPTSHAVTHNIETITVTEGPYNVEDFGVLSGGIDVTTKEPSQGFQGEVGLNFGSFGYKKTSATVSGGNERIEVLIAASKEDSAQYKDGNGHTLYEQNINANAANPMQQYDPSVKYLKAFEKQSVMLKTNLHLSDDHTLKLSYTDNMSEDILYPNTPMDAIYDASRIYNGEYIINNLGTYSKVLSVQAYQSNVDHPMSTLYRRASAGGANEVISHLTTQVVGVKVKNRMEFDDTALTLGLDGSNRNWDGVYKGAGVNSGFDGMITINDSDTINRALFVEATQKYDALDLKLGARYDMTTVDSANPSFEANEYNTLGGFLHATYQCNDFTKLFGGVGQSHRVPDARELYFQGKMKNTTTTPPTFANPLIGTDDLEATTNNEIDLGIEQYFDVADYKLKLFYSQLENYIYHFAASGMRQYTNIDATVYGAELEGSLYLDDSAVIDYTLAYAQGKKETLPTGHTDDNLADIPPLKGSLALNYYYDGGDNYFRAEVEAADTWDRFDADTGEQEIAGYAIANLKVSHDVTKHFNLTIGMDNVFDKAYAVSNTYNDLILVQTQGDILLLNEPGRYVYLDATYTF